MTDLTDSLKNVLADTFAFYLKTHFYHWNVEGQDFYEFHKFFEELYNEVWKAVDDIAEHIRALDEYAPGSFSRYAALTEIKDAVTVPLSSGHMGVEMSEHLLDDNDIVIETLRQAYVEAEKAGEVGVTNFLQDRIDTHKKHGWMLRATIKNR
jgi:starvation-inducible DNA-binding protein